MSQARSEPAARPSRSEEFDRLTTGVQFSSGSAVLAFLGAVAGSGLANEATLLRSAHGQWWSEVAVPFEQIVALAQTAGGRPFVRRGHNWIPLTAAGGVPGDGSAASIDLSDWQDVDIADLVSFVPLLPNRYVPTLTLDVLAPAALSRWVLKRGTALGLSVGLTPCVVRPLCGPGQDFGMTRLRLRADKGTIPMSLVQTLGRLPYTILGQATRGSGGEVVVDVRHRLAVMPHILSGMIAPNMIWVLGPADIGCWQLQAAGVEIDGATLLDVPDLTVVHAPSQSPAMAPMTVDVSLVPRRGVADRVDAVLLDAKELTWLRPFLDRRPASELLFLIPGASHFVVTAPAGLPGGGLPFGIPLVHVGPAGLFIELGYDFYPSLPDAARVAKFGLSTDDIVTVTRGTAIRFAIDHIRPAWSLWIGDVPEVRSGGESAEARRILNRISSEYAQRDVIPWVSSPARSGTRVRVRRENRGRLLDEAQRAELRGDLLGAAELLERAGYPGQAGRLYEREADRHRSA